MSSIGKPHIYYATHYTQHIVRASGEVIVNKHVPFTELHAQEAAQISQWRGLSLKRPPGPTFHHYEGLPLAAATNLVESWNNRNNDERPPKRGPFPMFFYTVE